MSLSALTAVVRQKIARLPGCMSRAVVAGYSGRQRMGGVAADKWLAVMVNRVPAHLDINADDSSLIEYAKLLAEFCADVRTQSLNSAEGRRVFFRSLQHPADLRYAKSIGWLLLLTNEWAELVPEQAGRFFWLQWVGRVCDAVGADVPVVDLDTYGEAALLARLCDQSWWRRQLRRTVGRVRESTAIDAGLVSRRGGLYVSADAMRRRTFQKRRNAALLESMIAVNQLGQQFTLAELAAVSVSNPAIRRPELMTRIAGFEMLAKAVGHVGEFYTLTCPSKFHAYVTDKTGLKAFPNPKYQQGLTPRKAQKHLCSVWANVRSALHRRGIDVYGFRVVEPHHDGTPHWHMLLFMEQRHVDVVRDIMRTRALAVDGGEAGADVHRFTAKAIDWSKGTAAGYIAKYICKNIDGVRPDGTSIGEDFEAAGMPAEAGAARVDAWASGWSFRQFQQIGGAPVTIWRELRRWSLDEVSEQEKLGRALWRELRGLPPEPLSLLEQAAIAADSGHWNTFLRLMGGAVVKRREMPLRLWKVGRNEEEARNRYGEACPGKVKGVFDVSEGEFIKTRLYEWVLQRSGEAAKPRSPVNNCTAQKFSGSPPVLAVPESEKIPVDWQALEREMAPRKRGERNRQEYRLAKWRGEIHWRGGADAVVADALATAQKTRNISNMLKKAPSLLKDWRKSGGVKSELSGKTESGRGGAGVGQHDDGTGCGQGVRSHGGNDNHGDGVGLGRGVAHGGCANKGHPADANATAGNHDIAERARAWLRATS